MAPTHGAFGYQPHGTVARMISRDGTNTHAVGDVVINSYAHTGHAYPVTTVAESELSPLACVIRALGAANATQNGYVGVVTDLRGGGGVNGSYIDVQFGGVVRAKVTATAAVVRGTRLGIHDTNGGFDTGAAAASTYPAAIALEALTSGTALIWVMLVPTPWFNADI